MGTPLGTRRQPASTIAGDDHIGDRTRDSKCQLIRHALWRLVLDSSMDPADRSWEWIASPEVDHWFVGIEQHRPEDCRQRGGTGLPMHGPYGTCPRQETQEAVPPRVAKEQLSAVGRVQLAAPMRNHVQGEVRSQTDDECGDRMSLEQSADDDAREHVVGDEHRPGCFPSPLLTGVREKGDPTIECKE